MKTLTLLKSYSDICDIHADRIAIALQHLRDLTPLKPDDFKNLSPESLGFFELLTSRFSKLQDVMGQKIFPLLLTALEEDASNKSLLDCLNRLEKLGYLESVSNWQKMREVRNSLTHEYPDNLDLMAHSLNQAITQANSLLVYWRELKNKLATRFLS